MKKLLLLLILSQLIGCVQLTTPSYIPSRENIEILKSYEQAKVKALPVKEIKNFDTTCRALGTIKPANNLTISQFIAKAFNDEFSAANIYDSNESSISVEIINLDVSSSVNLFGGYWYIEILIRGTNNKKIKVNHKYEFKTAYVGDVACNRTASALPIAVQGLIRAAVTHPDFYLLLDLF